MNKLAYYLSADINYPKVSLKIDVTDIPANNNSFDVILCNHVLEHVPSDSKAMSELFRVLKPGGWAILQVPVSLSLDKTYENPSVTSEADRIIEFGQKDHVRVYARDDYFRRLKRAGFAIEVFNFVKDYGEKEAEKYGLSKKEEVYVCSKRN